MWLLIHFLTYKTFALTDVINGTLSGLAGKIIITYQLINFIGITPGSGYVSP